MLSPVGRCFFQYTTDWSQPIQAVKKIAIFGAGKIARTIYSFLASDRRYEVTAFTCDADYIETDRVDGLPVLPFDRQQDGELDPTEVSLFVALGYQELNSLRTATVKRAKGAGYRLVSHVSPNAITADNLVYGENSIVMAGAIVQPGVELGNNVFVWGGASIGHDSRIGDNCWITSSANIAGDVRLGKNCFVGINATIGDGIEIGDNCIIGASTLVTRSLGDGTVVIHPSSEPYRLNSRQFLRMSNML